MFDRRWLLRGALTLGAAGLDTGAKADEGLFPFKDDKGRPAFNYRLPAELSVENVPGVVWVGAKAPTAILVEFFDYNCPHCRTASKDVSSLLRNDPALRLGLVNDPIFGPGSLQAAKVQQAVLRGYGPDKAFAFHERLLAIHGPADGPAALEVVKELGLDVQAVEKAADLPRVGEVIKRQAHLAEALGFNVTPSFAIDAIGIPGYPGPEALARAVAATRTCGKLVC